MNAGDMLIAANAFELTISISALLLLATYIIARLGKPRDFYWQIRRVLSPSFEGGSTDLAVAIFTIFLGKLIRTQTVWEWRVFDGDLSMWRLSLGLVISTLGAICLIRVLTPPGWFNLYWLGTVTAAVAVSWWSLLIS